MGEYQVKDLKNQQVLYILGNLHFKETIEGQLQNEIKPKLNVQVQDIARNRQDKAFLTSFEVETSREGEDV